MQSVVCTLVLQAQMEETMKGKSDMFDSMVEDEGKIRLGEDGWKLRYYQVGLPWLHLRKVLRAGSHGRLQGLGSVPAVARPAAAGHAVRAHHCSSIICGHVLEAAQP